MGTSEDFRPEVGGVENDAEFLNLDGLPPQIRQELQDMLSGKVLPPLYSDTIAKSVFHADIYPERVNFLLRSIAQDGTIDVRSSAVNEAVRQSLQSKGMIYDVPSWLQDGRLSDLGFQKAKQDFLFTRMDLYASDMLLLQYSVEAGQAKGELHYEDVRDVLVVVLMVESPKAFQEMDALSDRYIHRFTTRTADSGLSYPPKAKTIYVQLDKCLAQFLEGTNAEAADDGRAANGKQDTLQLWLSMIADINNETVIKAAETDRELQKIRKQVYDMMQTKEVQNMIIQERYNRMDWLSYGSQQKRTGIEEGLEQGLKQGLEQGLETGRLQGLEQGVRKGEIDMLVKLVKDRTLTVSQAAEKANLSEDAFREQYLTPASL